MNKISESNNKKNVTNIKYIILNKKINFWIIQYFIKKIHNIYSKFSGFFIALIDLFLRF